MENYCNFHAIIKKIENILNPNNSLLMYLEFFGIIRFK